jgi:oligopeptide/dipeptide ABC transporter ATP-binding protein
MREKLVEAKGLYKQYALKSDKLFAKRRYLKAVDGVTFDIYKGEFFGVVGESGCGKSTTAKLILDMEHPTKGTVLFKGRDMSTLKPKEWRAIRLDMQMIFQDPLGALDPYMCVGKQIMEPLEIHNIGDPKDRKQMVLDMLAAVSLKPIFYDRYPHELSGGQRQRIVLARALIVKPQLLVCDEPISALDVSIQAQVVNLFKRIHKELNLTFMFISHDLRIVKHVCDRIIVMYLGRVVEEAESDELFANTLHPYSQALISAVPSLTPDAQAKRIMLHGDPPNPIDLPKGCRFASRCSKCTPRCLESEPELVDVGNGHKVACFLVTGKEGINAR